MVANWCLDFFDDSFADHYLGRRSPAEIGRIIGRRARQVRPQATRVREREVGPVGQTHRVRGHVTDERFARAAGGIAAGVGARDEDGRAPDHDAEDR